MKLSPILLGGLTLFVGEVAAASTACNADNCARAVTGTRLAVASHSQDCQSFLSCTVTPVPTTLTSTATVTTTVAAVSAVTVTPAPILTTVTLPYPEAKRQPTANSRVTNCPSAVPTYASACSGTARYSSACSCFGVTRQTTTLAPVSTTVVQTVVVTSTLVVPSTTTLTPVTVPTTFQPSPPPTCGNVGMQWAYYRDYSPGPDYDPAHLKTESPDATGVTTYLHYYNPQGYENTEGTVYGTPDLPVFQMAINHRGYILAPETGTYQFYAFYVDDESFMWVGPNVYAGWDEENANSIATAHRVSDGFATYTADLVEGNYYPFRLVFWNRNRNDYGDLNYQVIAPSGYIVIDNGDIKKDYPYVVQYSCDGILAPAYPPWGQEI